MHAAAFRLTDEGITFRGRQLVPKTEIVAFRAYPDFLGNEGYAAIGNPIPRLAISLQDGNRRVMSCLGLRTAESAEGIRAFEQIPRE